MKSIDNIIKEWDWKAQEVGDEKIQVSTLISRIESGYWKTEKVTLNLDQIDLGGYDFGVENIFDFILHTRLVEKASLKYPVIIDHRGGIIDGRHRLVKALLKGDNTIKGVKLLDDIY